MVDTGSVVPTRECGVDLLKGLVDLFADLCAGEDNLAADEDEENNLRLVHAVDEAGEKLGLIRAEVVMLGGKAFQADRELDVAGADNVLDLEVGELGIEAELLDDTGIFAGRKLRIIFRLCTGNHHLARGEDERGRLGIADAHDDSGKTLVMTVSQGRDRGRPRALPLGCTLHCEHAAQSS